ncbi:rhodanese-like domain-containing protein [Carboxylicivirga sp. M1479]|uniref:rhodanese-like domain-containing protein n=1 Tax=Carboxylicivirga sp. M1479 TaxID=2594476 RepID=UPI0011775FE6|nr:rhodanese-like domain-containing protein [Carboxylicivirga sp. M1479]TRX66517.1 rhodanese-like domain-containing protein [Carboxylicivirga sp. M1479]
MDLKDAVVIDVRTIEEFQMGNVPGSINIPLDTIPNRLAEIKEIGKPLIVCCASGARSNSACGYLYQNGVTELYDGGPWTAVNSQLNN